MTYHPQNSHVHRWKITWEGRTNERTDGRIEGRKEGGKKEERRMEGRRKGGKRPPIELRNHIWKVVARIPMNQLVPFVKVAKLSGVSKNTIYFHMRKWISQHDLRVKKREEPPSKKKIKQNETIQEKPSRWPFGTFSLMLVEMRFWMNLGGLSLESSRKMRIPCCALKSPNRASMTIEYWSWPEGGSRFRPGAPTVNAPGKAETTLWSKIENNTEEIAI